MIIIMQSILTLLTILITTAYLTLIERKILASRQIRKGPNIVGIYGLLQPIADAIKLIIKETIKHHKTTKTLFLLSPALAIIIALTAWSIIPLDYKHPQRNPKLGIIIILALSSLRIYTILLSGWARNSKYALLGSIRATAQMIRYEVCIGIIILTIVSLSRRLNLRQIRMCQQKIWYILPLFPIFIMFTIRRIAETNRTPFDLTERESELVSGFNVEYSAILFTLLFLAEYINILLMARIIRILFLRGRTFLSVSNPRILAIKIIRISYLFICIRATFARIRYDQLMNLLWKRYLPLRLTLIILIPILEIRITAYT
uniref:NADH-ubiquinone oxidoreductase chain 1 n=1 Tax=Aphrocallistes vastus TaxID=83887 RepID=B2BRP7_APHVA|nr:NADH dehydrogenase subunit 1 [Aphrocallistes vastus]ABR58841.1 NADH dehydrogenase subunit 1 [Aphrocallistes vastus]